MARIGSVLIFIAFALIAQGRTVIVCDTIGCPVDSIVAIGFNEQMDSIAAYTTGKDGVISTAKEVMNLLLEHKHYSSKLVHLPSQPSDTITMQSAIDLKEVVVSGDMMKDAKTHLSYTIPRTQMEKYTNFYQSLNEIPNLVVLPSGGLFYEGNENVKVLLNGVETSMQELSTISMDDISKVNVYQTPPVRYSMQGVSAVIDVITKSNLTGGNIGLDIYQSPYTLKGENSAALYYNYKRSRFSMLYNNMNRHSKKMRLDESLHYEIDGEVYDKQKTGLDSKEHIDDNNVTLAFQNNLSGSYLYNLKVGVGFNRESATNHQDVVSNGSQYRADKTLNTKYDRWSVSNYFEKQLGEKAKYGTAMANVMYQRINTSYYSAYKEYREDSPIDTWNAYKTSYDAVLGEMMYELPRWSFGQMAFDVYDTYKYSEYRESVTPFNQKSNIFGASVQFMGWKNKLTYLVRMGVAGYHTAASSLKEDYNLWIPSPMILAVYAPKRNLQFRFGYTYSGGCPSIAQLSETEQWIDTRYVYHGNSQLKPYKEHKLTLRSALQSKYLDGTLTGYFISSPDMPCNHFVETDDYILETIINLDKYTTFGGQLDLTIKPLGSNKWTIWSRIISEKIRGEGLNYDWDGFRFQWMFSTTLNLEKWMANVFYQYPGKVVQGQLIRPRAQCWSITGYYKIKPNMSIGLEWFMPFGDSFDESERSTGSSLIQTANEIKVKDRVNQISIKFAWNISFGKLQNRARQRFDNATDDTGILKK